jgi:hypothetical protein
VGTRRPIMSMVDGQDLEPRKTLLTKIASIITIIMIIIIILAIN